MTDEPSDAELGRLAAQRDAAAWATIYARHHDHVYRYVRARVPSESAEDVTAEIFAAAVQSIRKYSGQRPLLAWLYGIARHRVADHHRGTRRREGILARLGLRDSRDTEASTTRTHDAFLAASAADPHTRAEVLDLAPAIEALTGDQREVVVLRYFVGLTTPEIAALLGRKASAIYSLEARALASLRRELH